MQLRVLKSVLSPTSWFYFAERSFCPVTFSPNSYAICKNLKEKMKRTSFQENYLVHLFLYQARLFSAHS
jgi:hypothetical protein